MIGIRIHGRGGQGAVTASRLLAEAAFLDGMFAQAIPMYGTERRGAPLTCFVRLDDKRVNVRELVHNPDMVIVLDPLLSTQQAVADGLKEGGLMVLNYPHPPEEAKIGGDFKIATIDATKIALETLKRPITNTAILGAFSKVAGMPKLESIEKAILHRFPGRIGEMNIAAIRRSYDEVSEVKSAPKLEVEPVKQDIHVGGYGVLKDVSSWRVFTPKIDLEKCTGCRTCWVYCPETAISWVENRPKIDYRKCKGCGICFNECPVKAIEFIREKV